MAKKKGVGLIIILILIVGGFYMYNKKEGGSFSWSFSYLNTCESDRQRLVNLGYCIGECVYLTEDMINCIGYGNINTWGHYNGYSTNCDGGDREDRIWKCLYGNTSRTFSKRIVENNEIFKVSYYSSIKPWKIEEPIPSNCRFKEAVYNAKIIDGRFNEYFNNNLNEYEMMCSATSTFNGKYCVGASGCVWKDFPSRVITIGTCAPSCVGKVCGNNGCGGSCGTCASGQTCSNGVCSSPSCTNDCTSGSKQCSGSGYQTCGNYDSDSCTEWSTTTSCATGQTCSGGVCSGGTTCNTPADTNCNGCIEDIGEWGNAVINWKSQTGGITDDNWILIVPKWKSQEGC